MVLAGGYGQAMAFGPALLGQNGLAIENSRHSKAKLLNQAGAIALSGHRDTHFAFLRNMKQGSIASLHFLDGTRKHYRLVERRVLDTRFEELIVNPNVPGLLLITCYPFNSLQYGGAERLIAVFAPHTSTMKTDRERAVIPL